MGILNHWSVLMLLLGAEVMYQQDYDEPYDSYDFEPEVPPDIEPPAFPHHTDYVNVYVPYPNECARECFCPPSYPFAMYCENRKLKTIPDIPQHIRHLYIQFNEIEAVNAKAFVNATSLRDINLSHNHIKSSMVDRGVFGKLKNLIQLHLDYNNLEEVPAPLPNTLERLFLGFNKISKLSADALQDLAKVTMLDLCNNKLTDAAVKGKILSGMKSLMQINLCNNRLKSMPSDLPASLLQLSLENNSISSIPEGYFKKTPNLMSLRISHNKLKTVPFKVFNLSSLMELNLGHNQLSKAFFIPRALEHLYLNHNEFLDLNVSLLCPTIQPTSPNLLTYIRIDHNKLRVPINTYIYLCFPRIQNIFYGEQRVDDNYLPPPVIQPSRPRSRGNVPDETQFEPSD
ncbi:osteomodulin [Amia ocellicauda]|uniref:osteomodulin n=1 Tax=Amia ocellicauda TaxID=2972642 RepID=UPI0034640FBA